MCVEGQKLFHRSRSEGWESRRLPRASSPTWPVSPWSSPGRLRRCPRSAPCTRTIPRRSHPSGLAAAVCTGSNADSTTTGLLLIYFHLTAINSALVWPLKAATCRRHLLPTTAGIGRPAGAPQTQPGPTQTQTWRSLGCCKKGMSRVPAALWGQAAPSSVPAVPEGLVSRLRAAQLRFRSIIHLSGR